MIRYLKYIAAAAALSLAGPALADKTTGEIIDDSVIQAEVKAKITAEQPITGGWDINLETRKGVVQLGGFVDDIEQAELAAQTAAAVQGVVEVDNQLHVRAGDRSAGQAIDDGITTTRVKAALAAADFGSAVKVNVDTYKGAVLLTGFVDTEEAKTQAAAIAAEDKNTEEVINGIYVME